MYAIRSYYESNRQREGPDQQHGHQFDEPDERLECHGHAGGPDEMGEVAESLGPDTRDEEDDPCQDRQESYNFV